MKQPSELVDAFRASGRKITPQRELIFSILHENPSHPTAEAVHARVVATMPSVSLRTVYATLHELTAMGEVVSLDLGLGSARFDPNTSDHQHFICTVCRTVHDVHVDATPLSLTADGALAACRVDDIEIVLRGLCARCAAPPTTSPDPGNNVHSDHRENPTNG